MKTCTKCNKHRPLSCFQKNKRAKDGLQSQCKDCHREYWKRRYAKSKEYTPPAEHTCSRCKETKPSSEFKRGASGKTGLDHSCRECNRKYAVAYRYGISFDQYERMLKSQNNCCCICSKNFDATAPCVDHCHKTKEVRGLLCGNCNKGLGHFKDDTDVMLKAVAYLENSQLVFV